MFTNCKHLFNFFLKIYKKPYMFTSPRKISAEVQANFTQFS